MTTTLPSLTGSEKQINWANQIRAQWIETYEFNSKYLKLTDEQQPIVDGLVARILNVKNAAWWIDARGKITTRTFTQIVFGAFCAKLITNDDRKKILGE